MPGVADSIIRYSRLIYETLGNRRKHERQPGRGMLNVSVKNQYGLIETRTCRCLDLSGTGVAVESEQAMVTSADAYVYSSQSRLKTFAEVRYCLRQPSGYRVGLQFRRQPKVWDGY